MKKAVFFHQRLNLKRSITIQWNSSQQSVWLSLKITPWQSNWMAPFCQYSLHCITASNDLIVTKRLSTKSHKRGNSNFWSFDFFAVIQATAELFFWHCVIEQSNYWQVFPSWIQFSESLTRAICKIPSSTFSYWKRERVTFTLCNVNAVK